MSPPVIEKKKKYTYKDYLCTPDDERYELIEGELIMTPSPVPYHQWVSKNIIYELEKYTREKGRGRIFYAPCDVHLDNENVIQPDILFIARNRLGIVGEINIEAAPDLVVEVLSKSTAYHDLVKKKKLYTRFGVKEYWIVDPIEKTVEIYTQENNNLVLTKSLSSDDLLESSLFPGLKIKLADVFAY